MLFNFKKTSWVSTLIGRIAHTLLGMSRLMPGKHFSATGLAAMMRFKDHWCKKLLENTKEIALLLPMTPTPETFTLACVLGRWESRIWQKQFQDRKLSSNAPNCHGKIFLIRPAVSLMEEQITKEV
jgi:hypothetical protein